MSKGAEITKLSVDKSKLLRRAGWAAVGALGYRQGKQAKEDYQTGRAMRAAAGILRCPVTLPLEMLLWTSSARLQSLVQSAKTRWTRR